MQVKHWYDYLWVVEISYFVLGLFNILFAWIGMVFFLTPLAISFIKGNKAYCNKYCGRGQLFAKVGGKLSPNRPLPRFMTTAWFRYGFLAFFMTMFLTMVLNTYLVFTGVQDLSQVITLLWTWKVPWGYPDVSMVRPWIAQYAYGFYSVMVTSTILGMVTMALSKPRGFCVYCPMGTMTQGICKLKHKE
ncbi:4Fe-4S binding protein [Bengtsoniella intestinalis]|uniref:4Fe-4S binding protein n=1 Tax=Bengtsoniella intestinalis TaxID=3073143 RepID=UPI00391F407F